MLEYPSASVRQGDLDKSIQATLQEQDFIQIIFKYFSCLFKSTTALREFVDLHRYYLEEKRQEEEDERGFKNTNANQMANTKGNEPFLSHNDKTKIEIEVLKRNILLVCYKILQALCEDQEGNQVLCSQYLPIMQTHSFFFPELITDIANLFANNQEILLTLKKKKTYSAGVLANTGLNLISDFEILILPRIDSEINRLVLAFYNEEGISSGASNFFYFYCFYMLKTNSISIRQQILDLFRKVSVYQGEGIGSNQDEIYNQIRSNFRELMRNQLYTISSRSKDIIITNPNTHKEEPIEIIFGLEEDPWTKLNKDRVELLDDSAFAIENVKEGLDEVNKEEQIGNTPFETIHNITDESREDTSLSNKRSAGGAAEILQTQISDIDTAGGQQSKDKLIFSQDQLKYTIVQMDFYSGMCLDRNMIWKGALEQRGYFSMEVLLEYIFKKFNDPSPSASLLRVLNEMYVDQKPMHRMMIPQLCKVLSALNTSSPPGSPSSKRRAGFNYELKDDLPHINQIQKKLLDYFSEVDKALKCMPKTFEEIEGEAQYDRFLIVQKLIINDLTLESVKMVRKIFNFGHYSIKVRSSQIRYLPNIFKKHPLPDEKDLTTILRTMLKILAFEPEFPETTSLTDGLRNSIRKLREDTDAVHAFLGKLVTFNYSEQYDKVLMVEDVEKKEDDAFSNYEAYFRQYLSKDMLFKNHFKYRNLTLENIKVQCMGMMETVIDYVSDSFANRVVEVFENTVISNALDIKVGQGLYTKNQQELIDKFLEAIEDQAEHVSPPISYTGLSLDFLNEHLLKGLVKNELSMNSLVRHSLFPILLLLFTFNQECEELSSKSIELLIKVFSQRVQIQRVVNKVFIIHGVEETKNYLKIKSDHNKLSDLCDEAENWIRSPNPKVRGDNIEKVVRYVDWFCRLLSSEAEENMGAAKISEVDNFSINKDMQELFRNLGVQDTIVDFIRDTFYIVCEFYEDATDPEIIFYFETLFLFLRKFCHKNPINQQLLSQDITVLLQDSFIDVGQSSTIIEIYKDNELLATTLASLVTDDFLRWIQKYGRRERLLDFFINLMKCGDKGYLLDNQRKILALFLDHPNRYDLLFFKPIVDSEGRVVTNELEFEPKINPEDRFYYDEPYRYHAKVLKLLCYSCAGKSGVYVNLVKVQGMFTLDYLVDKLFIEDGMTDLEDDFERNFYPIPDNYQSNSPMASYADMSPNTKQTQLKKRFLLMPESQSQSPPLSKAGSQFQSRVVSPPESPKHGSPLKQKRRREDLVRKRSRLSTAKISDLFKQQQGGRKSASLLKIAILELINIVYFESSSDSLEVIRLKDKFIQLFKHETKRLQGLKKECITQDYVEYLFDNLLRMSISISKRLLKDKEKEEMDEINDSFDIKMFVNALANKLELFEDDVLKIFKKELAQLSDHFQFEFGQRLEEVSKPVAILSKDELIVDKSSNEVHKYLWGYFLEAYNNSSKMMENIKSEKGILSKALNQIEDLFKIPLIQDQVNESEILTIMINLNKKRVIKSIIKFVVDNCKDKKRHNTLSEVLFCLGGMIPLDNEEITDQNRKAVEQEQAYLAECGATNMIMVQLTDPQMALIADDYTLNLLTFAIRLLEGGNTVIQAEFYSFMKMQNSSEVFFTKVYYLFLKEAEFTNKNEQSPNIDVVLNVLRLIQRFAEGHYTELQIYMRVQTNSLRSYNFLEEIVTLLVHYFDKGNQSLYEPILQCFDTITELIQGPCFENQKVLMQGRLMETVGRVLSIDEFLIMEAERIKISMPKEYSSGNMRPWMLAKIKNKCSITLISLIECRKDNSILRKMYTNLKKSLLTNIISFHINYSSIYKQLYDEEVFKHLEAIPSEEKDELYCCTIIQTAFNFYTIIRKNQESEENEEEENDYYEKSTDEDNLPGFLNLQTEGTIKALKEQEYQDAEGQILKPENFDDLKRNISIQRSNGEKAALAFMAKKTRSIEVVRQDELLERVYFLTLPYFEAITDEIKDEFNQEVSRVSCKTKCNDLLEQSKLLLFKLKTERNVLKQFGLRQIQKYYNMIKIVSYFIVLTVNALTLIFYKQGQNLELGATSAVDKTSNWVYFVQVALGVVIFLLGSIILCFDLYKEVPFLANEKRKHGWMAALQYFFQERGFILYYFVYVGAAAVGWFYPAWYTFHLNDILNISTVLKNIARSVWRPRTSIALTLILFVIVLYTYAALGFVYFKDQYTQAMPNKVPCLNIFECWVLTFDKGFKFDGGIGNYLANHNENASTFQGYIPVDIWRFFFENSLLIFGFIIILNIVTGIIIDTFGSLREEYNAYILDTFTYCFICGHDREALEKEFEGGEEVDGFDYHVKKEHFQWNYLFYIGYLHDKKDTEFTGLESHVDGLINDEKISWFPNHRAMIVKEDEGLEANEAAEEEIQTIVQHQEQVNKVTESLKKDLVTYQNFNVYKTGEPPQSLLSPDEPPSP